jgi:hypothetical protein
MSASEHLQTQQLKMLMTGSEIQAEFSPHPGDHLQKNRAGGSRTSETVGEVWRRKLRESKKDRNDYTGESGPVHGAGLHESVARRGVVHPIPLYHGAPNRLAPADMQEPSGQYVANGHHRVAAAAEMGKYVPVIHHGDEASGGTLPGLREAVWANGYEAHKKKIR